MKLGLEYIGISQEDVTPQEVSALTAGTPGGEYTVFPGFCDVHVHFREPGFSYKGTVRNGSLAAAHGGYTDVCAMPNLDPVPDSPENLQTELDIIARDAAVNVHPYGAITKGESGRELADMAGIAGKVIAFSDDGRGVQAGGMMREAMLEAKRLDKIIAAHCEDETLLHGGYINEGVYSRAHGHRGICAESEWRQIARDVDLAAQTGVKYHVCHISTKQSVSIIREAKKSGVDVTCETAPHYLLLDENDLREEGRFKMNPPLRAREDREALLEGLCDGTVDMIATDHAPHSAEEKARGLEKSPFGMVGLETAFPLLYTGLVKKGVITLERLVFLMSDSPRARFGIKESGYTVWDLSAKSVVNSEKFLSKGRATPFEGWEIFGECLLTVCGGKAVFDGTRRI